MNISRTLQFKEEMHGRSILQSLDASRFAFIADTSAYVLSFNPSISELTDQLSIDIKNIDVKSMKTVLSKINQENGVLFLEDKLGEFYDRAVKCIRSQQFCDVSVGRSLVAVLKNKSSLFIYWDNFDNWEKVANFDELMEKESKNISKIPLKCLDGECAESHRFANLFTKKLNVLSVCWSYMLADSNFGYFAVSHASGYISLWKVCSSSGRLTLVSGIDIGENIAEDVCFISCKSSVSQYLCLSFRDGRVCLLNLFSPCGGLTDISVTYIWDDADYVVARAVLFVEQHRVFLIPKNHQLILLNFDSLKVKQRNFPIQVLSLDAKYYISGIVSSGSEFIVGLFDGFLKKISLAEPKKPTEENLALPWIFQDWNIYDIETSKNQVHILVAVYPSKVFCSRIVKQPSMIHVICTKSLNWICNLVLNYSGPAYNIFDAMCQLKRELAQGNSWPQHFVDSLCNTDMWNNLPIPKLKIFRCLLSIYSLYLKTEDKEQFSGLVEKAEILILTKHISSIFELNSCVDKNSCSPDEKLSLSLMGRFIKKHGKSFPTASSPLSEICPICSGGVVFESHKIGTCKNGHKIARCNQTFLLCCQFPYRVCLVCKRMALPKYENFVLKGIFSDICLLCDGYVKMMDGF